MQKPNGERIFMFAFHAQKATVEPIAKNLLDSSIRYQNQQSHERLLIPYYRSTASEEGKWSVSSEETRTGVA